MVTGLGLCLATFVGASVSGDGHAAAVLAGLVPNPFAVTASGPRALPCIAHSRPAVRHVDHDARPCAGELYVAMLSGVDEGEPSLAWGGRHVAGVTKTDGSGNSRRRRTWT
jgi:hypothetical protein